MKAKDLRNSILQLAVQGKLVEQDPADEPASVLLERIRAERARLVKEKKVKAPKGGESVIYRASDGSHYEKRGDGEPVCIDDEIPFEIPESWAWARMGSVLTFVNGRAYKKPELLNAGKYPVLRVGNLFTNASWCYSNLELGPEKYCHKGDLLYAWSASFGPTIWEGDECIFHYHIWNVQHSDELCREYLYWFLLEDVNRVKNCTTGSTMIHVSMEHMMPRLLAIPPLKEQRRIARIISEIMPHVSEYGDLENAREALDAELPDRLRKSILQLAVQGKLVEQDPADEPASALIERIRAERARLVKEKKVKAPKGGESVIYRASDGGYYEKRGKGEPVPVEVPFGIPDSWEWARLSSLVELISGVDLASSKFNAAHEGIPYLTGASNFDRGTLIENRWTTDPRRLSIAGDLLFTCKGTVGEMAINSFEEAHIARQIMALRPFDYELLNYIQLFLESMVANIKATAKGVIPGIERATLLDALMPVPPKEEQTRIVERTKRLDSAIG